jgi:cobalt/nickel transport system permease protein
MTMMQRYLVLVLRKAEELHLARLSRGYGVETVGQGQRWAAAGMGIVLLSSLRLAEDVHKAMVARGYDGDIQAPHPPRWRTREVALVLGGLVLGAALLTWDRWLR